VTSGEVVGCSPERAGQTTCFYMIVGLIAIDRLHDSPGTARKFSHMPMPSPARPGLSYLPQEASSFAADLEENIRAVRNCRNCRRGIDRACGGCFGIEHRTLRQSTAPSLSAASVAASRIARALALDPLHTPREPFAGVDPIAVLDIQKIILFSRSAADRHSPHDHKRAGNPRNLRSCVHN